MSQTIFILGSSADQCAELRDILQKNISDTIVTTSVGDPDPQLKESDTVIITAEERKSGVFYRHLLNRLEEQVHRAKMLGDLMRLFSSTMRLEEILEQVVVKSTEVLGDTAFIILNSEAKLKLEAAFSTDRERLARMLVAAVNTSPHAVASELLRGVLEKGEPLVVSNLAQSHKELQPLVDKYGLMSLIATPIRTKDRILGAFVSMSASERALGQDDVAQAGELSDFTAMVVENARLFAELQRSATTDALTGLYNTRFFQEILSREAARSHRYSTPLSLLMVDVDSFKLVNDTFGHLVGDKVLTHIAQILEKTVRNTDFVFRCGGDEFGVVLPGTNTEGALHVAEKVLQKVQSSQILHAIGYTGPVTVSIGVSEYERGTHFETLVAEADQALYASKRSSKNCVQAYAKGK